MDMGQELPDGWEWTTLDKVCQVERGITFPASAKSNQWLEGNIACLRTANVQTFVDWDDLIYIPKFYVKNANKLLRQYDILMSTANSRELVGKVALIEQLPIECTLGGFISAIRSFDTINPKFLFYYLRMSATQKMLRNASNQTVNIANISLDDIYTLPVPLPSIQEQQLIVTVLEEQLTRLDDAIASLQQDKARLEQARVSVLKAAVEGTLTKVWHATHPDVETGEKLLTRILQERREKWEIDLRTKGKDPAKVKRFEPVEPDMEGLPELPEGWCWATVEQLAAAEQNSITDGPFGSNLKTEHYVNDGVRVIRLQNIGDGNFKDEKAFVSWEHYRTLKKHEVFAGDIVIAALGEHPPRSCVIPTFVGRAIVKADCIRYKVSSHISNAFINFALNAEPTKKRTNEKLHGVGRPRLNLSEIKAIVVPLAPFAEQQQIVSEVEQRLSVIAQAETVVVTSLTRAERTRQGILQKAFSGQLVQQNSYTIANHLGKVTHEELENSIKPSDKQNPLTLELIKVKERITSENLFKRVGLQQDLVEDIEDFYVQLREETNNKQIRESRSDDAVVYLEATNE